MYSTNEILLGCYDHLKDVAVKKLDPSLVILPLGQSGQKKVDEDALDNAKNLYAGATIQQYSELNHLQKGNIENAIKKIAEDVPSGTMVLVRSHEEFTETCRMFGIANPNGSMEYISVKYKTRSEPSYN